MLEANNVLLLKVAQLILSHFLVGCKPVVSLLVKGCEGTAELVCEHGTGHPYGKQHSVEC